MMLTPELIMQLWDWSQQRAPMEACGVVVGQETFTEAFECRNYAPDPIAEFWMHPKDLDQYRQNYPLIALWHSHPTKRWDLSVLDKRLMILVGLPMVLVAAKPFPSVSCYTFHGDLIVQSMKYHANGQRLEEI